MGDIKANTVLPARREPVTLQTADGLRLVGELAMPIVHEPVATIICLHPLPTHGGSMDSHLFRKAAWRLPALAEIAVLRFNTRGTSSEEGASEGTFDNAVGERFDVAAALDLAEYEGLPHPWLVGWSFGTDLALMHGCDPTVEGAVLLAPPLRYSQPADRQQWADSGRPLRVIVPEFDDYLRPEQARKEFAMVPQAEVIAIEGCKHLFVGYTESALDLIVAAIDPSRSPLPTAWPPPGGDATGA